MIKLHNTLTDTRDIFTPLQNSSVSLYTCGPTVYSEPHIGNWVAFIRWDTLVRTLRSSGYSVNRVMNITDVGHLVSDGDEGEDKIQKGARREGITAWEIAERYTERFLDGMEALNLLPPEHLTKATEHIGIQIELVQTLEAKGYTYRIDDGIYFDTAKFPTYADFAHLKLDALQAGARVEYNRQKQNPSDFALWKFSNPAEKRDMEWESPWGKGFPGWHLECSAMAMHYLGTSIDIHCGGIDHIPVHHTNEIAQSEAATGQRFANYWLHCNHLLSNGTKLSKSLGNSYTLRQLAEKGFSPMDFRLFILQSHYRTETNFTWDNLTAARNRLERWRTIACLRWQVNDTLVNDDDKDSRHDSNGAILAAPHAAMEAFEDDLNTPQALSKIDAVFDLVELTDPSHIQHSALTALIVWIDELLGLRLQETTPDISHEQKQSIFRRTQARINKDWQQSDSIRDELAAQGIYIRDTLSKTIWYRK